MQHRTTLHRQFCSTKCGTVRFVLYKAQINTATSIYDTFGIVMLYK